MKRIFEKNDLIDNFISLGIKSGDVVLIRADLGAVGRVKGGAQTFVDALLDVVGDEGTIVSLAFTKASFFKRPKIEDAFTLKKKSYAGALPNAMIDNPKSFRSRHPMCSYVAIGKYAREITDNHDENSSAYEPIRKIVDLKGKNVLVGCVESSPGFTTTHLAEADLGMLKSLPIFSRFLTVFYETKDGDYALYRRKDPGLCSNSFYKFYALYINSGILMTGMIGAAYAITAPAEKTYEIDLIKLKEDKKFNICNSKDCFTCNANRWDRVLYMPFFVLRKIIKKTKKLIFK